MNNDLPNDELLMRYLDGELSEEEHGQFELEMQNNTELNDRVRNLRIAIEAVRQAGTDEKIRGLHGKMMRTALNDEKADRPVRKIIRITMGIAASIVLLVAALGIYTYQLSSEKTFDDHFLNYSSFTSRGSEASIIPELFRKGNYQQVINEARSATVSSSDKIMLAISYLNLNQASSALPLLTELKKDERFQQDAEYYLGMAYLKNNEPGLALDELKKIHNNPKHSYHLQVSDGLIRELRLLNWKE
jgi:hypothetical protein